MKLKAYELINVTENINKNTVSMQQKYQHSKINFMRKSYSLV